MKKGLILFGTLAIGLLTACVMFNNNQIKEGTYQPRTSTIFNEGQYADFHRQFLQLTRGEVSHEEWVRLSELVAAMPKSRSHVTWSEHGPDNIGGRTRAILVDKDNINHIYAGSVSGGLFESFERANWWVPVTAFSDNKAISSMCQLPDGTIYVATGNSIESTNGGETSGGNGMGMYVLTRDANQMTTAVTLVPGSDDYTWINEIVCDTINNWIWVATNGGLKRYDPGTQTFTDWDSNGLSAGACNSLSISPDGQVIVCGMSSGKTNVSTDGGTTFLDMSSSSNTSNPISGGAARLEYAISHERNSNGDYSIYAVAGNTQYLSGCYYSTDNGVNWTQNAPANNQAPGSFAPFSTGAGGQAWYDMIISVQKGNPNKVFLGGINVFSWATNGNWAQLSNSFAATQSDFYVHADQHEMVWDKWGRLYIGNDGGVFFSDDGGATFHQANRGYNVTQFYDIGASAHGDVIGGAQDNGSLVNYHDNATWHEFDEVLGGDGYTNHISFINRNILFSSLYYAGFYRSADRGQSQTLFVPDEFSTTGTNNLGCNPGNPDGSGCGSFYSESQLWENPNDLNSTDSVSYIPGQAYSANDTVPVPSMSTGVTIDYITPTDIIYDDTLYYNPGLTGEDTIITSSSPSNDYNLSVFTWSFHTGAPGVNVGDSIHLVDIDTIVEVAAVSTIDHFYGTNPNDPGDVYDMGNDSVAYGIAWDTLTVQDPYQSWMAYGLGGNDGIWMTRNALRFSADASDWFRVDHTNTSDAVSTLEFSRDGNHLFVGTFSGNLYRLSGFGNVYSPEKGDDTLIDVYNVTNTANLVTTWSLIESFGNSVNGIAVGSDPDHVVVTLGGFSGGTKVRETTNATGAADFFSIAGDLPQINLMGPGGPTSIPAYSAVIDRNDPNLIFIGTEMGVFVTENGGTNWENSSEPFGNVPVYDMLQNWRTYDEGCYRPGEIYIGTHGRGIFSSDTYLSTPDQDQLSKDKYIPSGINIYPNPMVDQGNIAFTLENASNVNISIFSLSGKLVQEINETNVAAGDNNIEFGVGQLPAGTYIIRMTAGDRVETSKFIKQ